ncbi:MAG TPA: acyl carrier protein [Clostridiales bacterium]|nr:acyl carrier protein [Clostridiales bacterium]
MILDKIKDIMETELGKNRNDVTLECDIIKDLGLDSLDIVTLIMAVEDEYGFTADDDEIAALKTVGDVVSYIEKRTNHR